MSTPYPTKDVVKLMHVIRGWEVSSSRRWWSCEISRRICQPEVTFEWDKVLYHRRGPATPSPPPSYAASGFCCFSSFSCGWLSPFLSVNCNLSTGTLVLDLVFSVDYPLVCVVWNLTKCLYLLLINKNVFPIPTWVVCQLVQLALATFGGSSGIGLNWRKRIGQLYCPVLSNSLLRSEVILSPV